MDKTNERGRGRQWSYHVCCMVAAGGALACGLWLEAALCVAGSTVVIVIHELAHVAVGKLVGVRIKGTHILPWHGYTRLTATQAERQTVGFLAFALAGPLAGLASAGIAYIVAAQMALPAALAGGLRLLSLALCGDTVVNLLPVWRFDGKFAANALKAIWKAANTRAKTAMPAEPEAHRDVQAAPAPRACSSSPDRAEGRRSGYALTARAVRMLEEQWAMRPIHRDRSPWAGSAGRHAPIRISNGSPSTSMRPPLRRSAMKSRWTTEEFVPPVSG